MARVLRIPTTRGQRALAAYREEQLAFRVVLAALRDWKRDALFVKVFSLYRARMRFLRNCAAGLLMDIEEETAVEELKRFARERDPG
jgi:hypothetical protein